MKRPTFIPCSVTRRSFIAGAAAFASVGPARSAPADERYADLQRLIDAVSPADYSACRGGGEPKLPALRIYDGALEKALHAIESADVAKRPAVAFVYNMGVLVRTQGRLFSIDLCHRRACELADRLDFALITHNHDDHYTAKFLREMNRRGKTVVSNFDDNYAAHFGGRNPGGYTRGGKSFVFGDVTVKTSVSDHNPYLIDFTMPFEITVGESTIYHTGDSQNLAKLNPSRPPDLWLAHPFNGLDVVAAARKFKPRLTALVHLNELGHARDRWRWSFAQGEEQRQRLEAAGFPAVLPLWGERLPYGTDDAGGLRS